jgi:hypothetical protein
MLRGAPRPSGGHAGRSVDIVFDNISDNNTVTGTISGSYATSGGIECTFADGGSITIER